MLFAIMPILSAYRSSTSVLSNYACRSVPHQQSTDEIFGAEFLKDVQNSNPSPSSKKAPRYLTYEERQKVMTGYQKVRVTILSDSLLISVVGFSLVWLLASYKDAISFGIGAILGSIYTILLGKYVENIGTQNRSKFGENVRFLPAIILIALYGKLKTVIAIIPELAGFFTSYQLASLLQAFNQDLYGESDEDMDKNGKD
jgi:hypothetical protein